jgi:hypothetical protein
MAILLLKWKDLMVTFFDENHARSIGLNTRGLKLLFFTLLAACTVAALQTVGAFLVICLVVTPGATAWLLTDRFPRLLAIAVAIGSLTSFFGAWLSYYLDGATGGIIVVAQTLLFLITFIFAPKHGLLASRRRAREAHAEPVPGPVPVSFYGQCDSGIDHRGRALRATVGVSGAQRLGADGRRHEPRGLSGRGAGLHYRHPLRHRRVYRRAAVRRDDRFSRR